MIINAPVIVSRDGKLRLANRKPTPGKDEIAVNLVLDVPESAFAPPALTMRATVAPSANGHAVIERPVSAPAPARKPRTLVKDDGQPWTPARVRGLMAILDIDRDGLARLVGVATTTVKRWETTGDVEAAFRDELATLEADAKAVSA